MLKEQVERTDLWDSQSDTKLIKMVEIYDEKNWDKIAGEFPKFDKADCLIRYRNMFQIKSKKGPWNEVEDKLLVSAVKKLGNSDSLWNNIATLVPGRNSKQCRERWRNQLDPEIDRSPITEEEDRILIEKIAEIGNKWCKLSALFPGRPDNMLKNHWYSVLYPKVLKEQKQKEKPIISGKRVARSDLKKLTRRKKKKKSNTQYYPPFSTRKRTLNKEQNKDDLKKTQVTTRSQKDKKRRLLKNKNNNRNSNTNSHRNTSTNTRATSTNSKGSKKTNNRKKNRSRKKRYRIVIKNRRNPQKEKEEFPHKLKEIEIENENENEKSQFNKPTPLTEEFQLIDAIDFQKSEIKTDPRPIKNEPNIFFPIESNSSSSSTINNNCSPSHENITNIENLKLSTNQIYYLYSNNINNNFNFNLNVNNSNNLVNDNSANVQNYDQEFKNSPKLTFLENSISNDFQNFCPNLNTNTSTNTNTNASPLSIDECLWNNNNNLNNSTMSDINSWDLFQNCEYFD
ncbi:transcription factor myb119-related [Anaeramoeba flamelloides]|uniref:Transcription factor myb119-related n=1 Tax=Anaeramoeba flamelloides TaxID=1746091 RepID=A0AAV7YK43_9EUKA|nr:transcription factor myb119-related [Anaeramoeba flamelloides]